MNPGEVPSQACLPLLALEAKIDSLLPGSMSTPLLASTAAVSQRHCAARLSVRFHWFL